MPGKEVGSMSAGEEKAAGPVVSVRGGGAPETEYNARA